MKRTALVLSLIMALLFSAVAGTRLFNYAAANPYFIGGQTPPPEGTEPPIISIVSPKNNTVSASNNISLAFNVTGIYMLTDIYYEVDWQEGNTSAYHLDMSTPDYLYDRSWITEFFYNETLIGIPEGRHTIRIIAYAFGSYVIGQTAYVFDIGGSSSVYFEIDATPPKVSVLSFENRTYSTSDLPLNFTVNELFSKISYVLDGLENVTVDRNTTLTNLANGYHNVTVYATDEAGNIGASETLYFTIEVPEPFPTTLVAAASGVSAAVIGMGLLVYLRKRKR